MRFYTNCRFIKSVSAASAIKQASFWNSSKMHQILQLLSKSNGLQKIKKLGQLKKIDINKKKLRPSYIFGLGPKPLRILGHRSSKKFTSAVLHIGCRFSPKTHLEFTWTIIFWKDYESESSKFHWIRSPRYRIGSLAYVYRHSRLSRCKIPQSKLSLTFKTIKFCISMFIQSHEPFRHYIRDLVYSVSSQNIAGPQSCN